MAANRRHPEFVHKTTIFEGAFRAWSHLGGLDPEDLESKPSEDLDPLTNPIVNDRRLTGKHTQNKPEGSSRREYPYEPLPRAGLSHPFVQVRTFRERVLNFDCLPVSLLTLLIFRRFFHHG
jgi:hypothetical protein